jgi:hypothetical protein
MSVACKGEFCIQGSGSVQGRRLTDTVRRLRSTATARWTGELAHGPFVSRGRGFVAPHSFPPAVPGVDDAGTSCASDAWCATPRWQWEQAGDLRPAMNELPTRHTPSGTAPIPSIAAGRCSSLQTYVAHRPLVEPAPSSAPRTPMRSDGSVGAKADGRCSPVSPPGGLAVVPVFRIDRSQRFVSPACTAAGKACDEKRNADERPPAGGKPDCAR